MGVPPVPAAEMGFPLQPLRRIPRGFPGGIPGFRHGLDLPRPKKRKSGFLKRSDKTEQNKYVSPWTRTC